MKEQISLKISEWLNTHKDEILSDLKKAVNIPSISKPDSDIKPYGKACREVLDCMLEAAADYGFDVQNYQYHVGGVSLSRSSVPSRRVGIWTHLDVVPVGEGWSFPPFSLTEKNGFLIGRGVQDNKCAAVGVLHAFRCINELFPKLRYEYILYMGCSEENTMNDVKFFVSHYDQPDLSLVADSGFPVCYGEKGIADLCFISEKPLPDCVVAFSAGNASNIIPDTASITLRLDGCGHPKEQSRSDCPTKNYIDILQSFPEIQVIRDESDAHTFTITAKGISAHVIAPEQGKNAIYVLLDALKKSGLINSSESWVDFLLKMSADGYGQAAGAACSDSLSGPLIGSATVAELANGILKIRANYRYPIFDGERISDGSRLLNSLENLARAHGFSMSVPKNSKPSFFDPQSPVVTSLTDTFNRVTNMQRKASTSSGGTYARELQNAVAFGMTMPGMSIYREYDNDPRGNFHQANESLNIKDYLKAIEVYIQCIVELDRQEI